MNEVSQSVELPVPNFMDLCLEGSFDDVKNYFQSEAQTISENESFFKERDLYQKSVLDKMAMLGKGDVLRFLLQSGFNVNDKSEQGYTALHHAACWGHIPCIKELFFAGADLSITNAHKETPRDCAMRYGQQEAVNFLDKAIGMLAQGSVDLINVARRSDRVQELLKHFWKRWMQEPFPGFNAHEK